VRRLQVWNDDLNGHAKAINQMIMGMIDVPIKQQSTSING